MQLSKHFKREELECRCGCGTFIYNQDLLDVLEDLREEFGPINVTSATRCKSHNKAVGGVDNSRHVLGEAVDVQAVKATPDEVYKYLEAKYPSDKGLGKYNTFTHIDVRDTKSRWDYSSK